MRGKTVIYILHKYIFGHFGNQQEATNLINNRLNKQQILKTTDFQKQQISKNRFQKQQISKNSRFHKQQLKNNRFQKTTNLKKGFQKQQIKNNIFQ